MKNTDTEKWKTSLQALKDGNRKYLNAQTSGGDISPEKRLHAFKNGQAPYAVVVSCSDSRVLPESIFFAGIGDLFVIRVAGNVTDGIALGSIEYALSHLKTPLVVVLGHTCCGAVNAAIKGGACGNIKMITDKIRLAISGERDDCYASRLNVEAEVNAIKKALAKANLCAETIGAIYRTDTGEVEFLENSENL